MNLNKTMLLRLFACSGLASMLAACGGQSAYLPPTGQSVISPERSARGNPAVYEVFGERYYVMNTSDGFRENGIASWYGHDFHGKPTSSGEVYDMYELTAAHKTLPIPTWVEVTNLNNGKRVIVKVNDRGPFVDGRVIDLSLRAAEAIDMVDAGTAQVQVRALGTSSYAPSAGSLAASDSSRGFSIISDARADTPSATGSFYLQVGAYSDRNNAMRMADQLKSEGFGNSFVLTTGDGRDRMHRVRIGPLASESHVDRTRAELRGAGVHESTLILENGR